MWAYGQFSKLFIFNYLFILIFNFIFKALLLIPILLFKLYYGQFSKCHVCFCGLDSGKFEI